MPMSPQIFRALFSAAVLFRWYPLALILLFGWAGALRPGEMASLRWKDILYDPEEESAYIFIVNPKTRKRAARKQYVRVDAEEPCEAARLVHAIAGLRGDDRVCALSLHSIRVRF